MNIVKETVRKIYNKIKALDKRGKIVVACSGCVVILALTIALGITILKESGRRSLYNNADSEKPNLVQAEKETEERFELDINPDQMDEIEVVENDTSSQEAIDNTTDKAQDNTTEQNSTTQNTNTEQNDTTQNSTTGQNSQTATTGTNSTWQNITGEEMDVELEQPTTTVGTVEKPTTNQSATKDYDVTYKGKNYKYNDKTINLLFLGIDKREVVTPAKDGISGGQSDAIFILTLNPKTKIMDMIAIPRDTITEIDLYTKEGQYAYSGYAQVCLQHGYGDGMEISNERAKKTISEMLYDLPIQSVTSVNMGAMPDLNDAFGGITLTSLYTFFDEGYQFVQGEEVHLKGNLAYSYVHYRDTSRHYTAPERLERQKQYMNLFIAQAMHQIHEYPGKVVDVYNAIKDYVVTDLGIDDMTYLATELSKYTFGDIHTLEGTVDTSRKYERYYLDEDALYQLIIDQFYEEV